MAACPQFADVDGDGDLDLISGSNEPARIHVFARQENGLFDRPIALQDAAGGEVSLPFPDDEADYRKVTHPSFVDWDDDGDLDLIVGGFLGKIRLFLNNGSKTSPAYESRGRPVQAAGRDMDLYMGTAPLAHDWDGDGLFDILSGLYEGGVAMFKNVGKPGSPVFEEARYLVPRPDDVHQPGFPLDDEKMIPGTRTYVHVTDYDGDGHDDLLVGDLICNHNLKPGLTPQKLSRARVCLDRLADVIVESKRVRMEFSRSHYQRALDEGIPNDERMKTFSQDWAEHVKTGPQWKLFVELKNLRIESDEYLDHNTPHVRGHVWVYLRKPAARLKDR